MMNYETFKEAVAESLLEYMPAENKNMTVSVEPVVKVNRTLDGLRLRNDNQEGICVSPYIYLNDLYEDYKKTNDLVWVLMHAANAMKQAISHDLASALGLTEEKLFTLAMENTRKMFPTVVRNLNEVLREMMIEDGMPPELADMMFSDDQLDGCPTLFMISNVSKMNGAAAVLYEDVLRELAERFDSDLYILPSSIHEVIAVPIVDDMLPPEELSGMVTSVNSEQVGIEDRLSNQVYRYDKASGKIAIA